mmetsp:Transcript_95531/g.270230  ORF Transcript_95531/g.270230 Transcript_95531/m.270230 type:complete len:235 (+) Transcript_95531:237-941(+)
MARLQAHFSTTSPASGTKAGTISSPSFLTTCASKRFGGWRVTLISPGLKSGALMATRASTCDLVKAHATTMSRRAAWSAATKVCSACSHTRRCCLLTPWCSLKATRHTMGPLPCALEPRAEATHQDRGYCSVPWRCSCGCGTHRRPGPRGHRQGRNRCRVSPGVCGVVQFWRRLRRGSRHRSYCLAPRSCCRGVPKTSAPFRSPRIRSAIGAQRPTTSLISSSCPLAVLRRMRG